MPYNLDIPGWMPESELKILERLALTIPAAGAMLEVGPFCGRSSWCWAKSVHPSVSITCVDIWNPAEHPYHPLAKIGQHAEIDADFGKVTTVERALGTKENFDHYTRDCHNYYRHSRTAISPVHRHVTAKSNAEKHGPITSANDHEESMMH
jgi:hypothetical protein